MPPERSDSADHSSGHGGSLDLTCRVQIGEGVLFREVGGEAVLVQLETGLYFGLDEVGTRMWRALVEQALLEEAFEVLLAEYEVEPDRLRRDFLELVGQMLDNRLLRVNED